MYEIVVEQTDGQFRALVTADWDSGPLYRTECYPHEGSARQAAERWLSWFTNVSKGKVESIYYILEVPETWAGPPSETNIYSGLRVKIGLTNDVRKRLSNLRTGTSSKLIVHALEPGDRRLEANRHGQFASDRRQGEWFACSPALTRHMMSTWYRNRALPPEHQREVFDLQERIQILKGIRGELGRAPDMINPSLNEEWHGKVFVDLVYAHRVNE